MQEEQYFKETNRQNMYGMHVSGIVDIGITHINLLQNIIFIRQYKACI